MLSLKVNFPVPLQSLKLNHLSLSLSLSISVSSFTPLSHQLAPDHRDPAERLQVWNMSYPVCDCDRVQSGLQQSCIQRGQQRGYPGCHALPKAGKERGQTSVIPLHSAPNLPSSYRWQISNCLYTSKIVLWPYCFMAE